MKILICEDDLILIKTMTRTFEKRKYNVFSCSTGEDCLTIFKKKDHEVEVLLLDIGLPDFSGTELVKQIKILSPETIVIMISGERNSKIIVECMKNGAYNFIDKPFEQDYLINCIEDAFQESKSYKRSLAKVSESVVVEKFISTNREIIDILSIIEKMKNKNPSVILYGESGSGKEYFAEKIYASRDNKNVPFISVNCPAIPSNLAESELFGHEKGAFTGADKQRVGKFEAANGGIIFLDEVSDLAPEVQVKLLRVLEEREVERLGSNDKIAVNFQVIVASSKNLKEEAQKGNFRIDLYYRLADVEIHIPPLRNRLEDISSLVNLFITQFYEENESQEIIFSNEVINYLKEYSWPGNIRELRSTVRRLLLLSDKRIVEIDELQKTHFNIPRQRIVSELGSLEGAEKNEIVNILKQEEGNISNASKTLGVSRSTLYRKMKKYSIDN